MPSRRARGPYDAGEGVRLADGRLRGAAGGGRPRSAAWGAPWEPYGEPVEDNAPDVLSHTPRRPGFRQWGGHWVPPGTFRLPGVPPRRSKDDYLTTIQFRDRPAGVVGVTEIPRAWNR